MSDTSRFNSDDIGDKLKRHAANISDGAPKKKQLPGLLNIVEEKQPDEQAIAGSSLPKNYINLDDPNWNLYVLGETQIHESIIYKGKPEDFVIQKQVRGKFDQENLTQLAESMRSEEQLQPAVMTQITDGPNAGKLLLVVGESRCRAVDLLRKSGNDDVYLDFVVKTEISNITLAQFTENTQRAPLTPREEAETIQLLKNIDTLTGEPYRKPLTHELLATKLHKSRKFIMNRLQLLKYPERVATLVDEKDVRDGPFLSAMTAIYGIDEELGDLLIDGLLKGNVFSRPMAVRVRRTLEHDELDLKLRDLISRMITNDSEIIDLLLELKSHSVDRYTLIVESAIDKGEIDSVIVRQEIKLAEKEETRKEVQTEQTVDQEQSSKQGSAIEKSEVTASGQEDKTSVELHSSNDEQSSTSGLTLDSNQNEVTEPVSEDHHSGAESDLAAAKVDNPGIVDLDPIDRVFRFMYRSEFEVTIDLSVADDDPVYVWVLKTENSKLKRVHISELSLIAID